MKLGKKIQKRYDQRIHAYSCGETKVDDLKGYKMPGSRNPKKLRKR
jgi:hypothetical protein